MTGYICGVKVTDTFMFGELRKKETHNDYIITMVTTSLRCCVSYTGYLSKDEWSSRLCVVYTSL